MRRSLGSITKTSKNRWLVQVSKNGKRLSKRVQGTKREAESELRELLERAEEEPVETRPTLDEFFERDFMRRCVLKDLSPTTIQGYRCNFSAHISPAFGKMRLDEVTPSSVSRLLTSLSYGASRHVKACLSTIFSYAEELELVDRSVMRRKYTLPAKTPANTAKRPDLTVLSWEQMERIATACAGESWEPAFLLMAFGGMRRSEACGVQPGDVEARTGDDGTVWAIVHLGRTVTMVDNAAHVSSKMKTPESRRDVVIAPPWASRLLELVQRAEAEGRVWMMQDADGNVLTPECVAARYDKWFATRPYRRVPMRNLRNSYTTAMVSAGVDAALVSKMTGHASMDVTYRHYLRPDASDVMRALGDRPGAGDAGWCGGDAISRRD